jgi:hypothetical protein
MSSSGQCGLFSVTRYATSLEVIEPPSEEVLEKVRSEFGLNERRVREAVEQLKEWLVLQPHLPKEMGTFGKDIVNTPTSVIEIGT